MHIELLELLESMVAKIEDQEHVIKDQSPGTRQ